MRRDKLSLPPPPATDRPGDRWACGRPSGHAPCARGPSAGGVCTQTEPCRPQRTWHGRRTRITGAVFSALLVTLTAVYWSRHAATIFKPGDLSTPHAQILAGTLTSQRCGSCHPQAATSPQSWFTGASAGHADVSLTDRCLDCHHSTIDRATAKLAHNLPSRVREELRLASLVPRDVTWHDSLPSAAVEQEDVQCSACHREHRGSDADLMAVSDSQCQTCHSDRFGSFATSHPNWDRWPYGRGGRIAFDHASHVHKHFPSTGPTRQQDQSGDTISPTPFQCADCHRITADNELTRSTSYERACQQCHDAALRIETATGIDLLALPTIPQTSADRIHPWPESATGFYDGKLAAMANLLMRSDPETAAAIRRLPDQDFSRISPRDLRSVSAAESVALAHRELIGDITRRGQQAIVDRARALGVTDSTLSAFVRSLSPQLIREANRHWFPDSKAQPRATFPDPPSGASDGESQLTESQLTESQLTESQLTESQLTESQLTADEDLLGDADELLGEQDLLGQSDPLQADPLQADPLAVDSSAQSHDDRSDQGDQFDAQQMMPSGGWYWDPLRLAIRYRGGGHDDPVLKLAIEMVSQLPPGDPARESLLATRAVAACLDCHPGAVSAGGRWRSEPLTRGVLGFTKFSHKPHLNVAGLADCSHCHAIAASPGEAIQLVSGAGEHCDFEPLQREACAACHTAQAAGEECIKCHRYHIRSAWAR